MPKSEKYWMGEVDCDYSELRIVSAKTATEARKKLEKGHYEAVFPGNIEAVRNVNEVERATPNIIREFTLHAAKLQRLKSPKD